MMPKRRFDDENLDLAQPKRLCRIRGDSKDRLSSLSDELLLQILSSLPIPSLLICQRVSRRFHALAGDSELWKKKYYSRWVQPRARRIANIRRTKLPASRIEYSPQVSKWLGHGHLAGEGKPTNWKKQYRLRHNWSKGICQVTEIEFPQPARPPLLVKFCAGFIFTADSEYGVRCWLASNPKSCLAKLPLSNSGSEASVTPTALAVTCSLQQNTVKVAVGFESGHFSIYDMDTKTLRLSLRFSHASSANGAITAMAASIPYLLMVSQHKVLSLYEMSSAESGNSGRSNESDLSEPEAETGVRLVVSLNADSILSPISLSIRVTGSEIITSIVYSFLHIGSGWSLGIQELHFDKNGQQISSRLATTVDSQYGATPLPRKGYRSSSAYGAVGGELHAGPTEPSILHREPPTSISYSHPYLLTSHADNTLTVYLVVSTGAKLYVNGGQRLWGHTSSVSAVQVSERGKAISVSSHGGEMRVWELETLIMSIGSSGALTAENSIRISPENKPCRRHEGLNSVTEISPWSHSSSAELPRRFAFMRGCVGFDDERVLLLWEKEVGTQLIELYDFT